MSNLEKQNNQLRNLLVDLPFSVDDVLAGVDAVIVTHTHLDHWDEAAQKALPKDIPLLQAAFPYSRY